MSTSRRHFVKSAVASSMLMPGLLSELLAADAADSANPVAPKQPHFPAKAKSVIFLFMSGGVSHIDSFDPKPQLFADHGKEVVFDHPETRNRPGYEKIFSNVRTGSSRREVRAASKSATCFLTLPSRRMTSLSFARCIPAIRITTTPRWACTPGRLRLLGQVSGRG